MFGLIIEAYRPFSIETGVIPQASGSARVKLGATDAIASVKAELGKPNPSHPDKGKVSINVDCSPTAEPTFEVLLCYHSWHVRLLDKQWILLSSKMQSILFYLFRLVMEGSRCKAVASLYTLV